MKTHSDNINPLSGFQCPDDKADVRITSIWYKHPPVRPSNFEYTVRVDRGDTEWATLSNAFMATNMDNRPFGDKVCSTTAGDLIELDGKSYLVQGDGFFPVALEEAVKIKTLACRQTTMGFDWLKSQNLV